MVEERDMAIALRRLAILESGPLRTTDELLEWSKLRKWVIDNDLLETDHCPGYGSAARFVAHAFQGDGADNRSLKGIKINVLMGRHAGWLTAASTLGKST